MTSQGSREERESRYRLKRRSLLYIPFAASAAGLAGCGFDDSPTQQQSQGTQKGPGTVKGDDKSLTSTFRQANRPVNHLNPAFLGWGQPEGSWIVSMMREGLLNRDVTQLSKFIPGVADTWKVSSDGLTYSFHIREGAKWSDGKPLTAEDFVWTYSYYYSPALAKQGNKNPVAYDGSPTATTIKGMPEYFSGKSDDFSQVGVKAKDSQTLVFTLTDPDFTFMGNLVDTYPLRRDNVEGHEKDFWVAEEFVGNGPYKLTSYKQNSGATLELNEHYWDAQNYGIKHRTIQFNASGTTGMAVSYNANEIDLFRVDGDPTAIVSGRPELADQLRRAAQTQFKGLSLLPSKNRVLHQSQKLRHALALAIDRKALAKVAPPDVAGPSWVPPAVAGYDQLPQIPFDPDQARQLEAEAGFENGKGVPKLQIITYAKMPILEAVASMWKKYLNIDTSVAVKESGVRRNMLYGDLPPDFTGFTFNYRGSNPLSMMNFVKRPFFNEYNYVPYDIGRRYFELNYGKDQNKYSASERVEKVNAMLEKNWLPGYKNYVKLAKKALAAQADTDKAISLATEAATAFQETYFYIPLLWTGYTFMVKPRVHDIHLSSMSDTMFYLKGVTLDPVQS